MILFPINYVLFIPIKTTEQFCFYFLSFCFNNKRLMMGMTGGLDHIVAELPSEPHHAYQQGDMWEGTAP